MYFERKNEKKHSKGALVCEESPYLVNKKINESSYGTIVKP